MNDYMIRATAANHRVRAFGATTKNLVEEARQRHEATPVVTAALGRLLTAGVMMGSMMKGKDDVLTLKVEGNGPMKGMVVTGDSMGNVKGYPFQPQVDLPLNAKGKLDVAGAVGIGVLSVIKDEGLKEPYVGQTILTTSEIAEDLTYYFATSEQVPSSVGLGVLVGGDGKVRQAGGFIIQLMPEAGEDVISKLEQRLGKISSVTAMLEQGMTPEDILKELLGDMELEILDRTPARFFCNCSKERVEKALVSLGEKELTELIASDEPAEVKCHFCNTAYVFEKEDLERILEKSRP